MSANPVGWADTPAVRELREAASECGLVIDPLAEREADWGLDPFDLLRLHRAWSAKMRARCGFSESQPTPAERVSPLRGTTRDESPEERAERYTNKAYRDAPTLQSLAVQALGTTPEEAMSADAVVVALGLPRGLDTTNQVQARLALAARRGEVRRRQDRRAGRGPKVCWAYWRVAA